MTPDLRQEISTAQNQDSDFQEFKKNMLNKGGMDFKERDHKILYFRE
jgi:hypothetical protein